MEAISVPSPPRLVPTMSDEYSSVKPERSSAAGTLLMIWLERIPRGEIEKPFGGEIGRGKDDTQG